MKKKKIRIAVNYKKETKKINKIKDKSERKTGQIDKKRRKKINFVFAEKSRFND